jgi:hypothetical protein
MIRLISPASPTAFVLDLLEMFLPFIFQFGIRYNVLFPNVSDLVLLLLLQLLRVSGSLLS